MSTRERRELTDVLDWLVIGGGVQGTVVSHALIHGGHVHRHALRVLDPHPQMLTAWNRLTGNVQMTFLRSLSHDHIDLEPSSLVRFARSPRGRRHARFLTKRPCPSLELFNTHAQDVINRYRLGELRCRGRGMGIEPGPRGIRVETDRGTLTARHVILATGLDGELVWPAWARELRRAGAPILHVLEPAYRFETVCRWDRIAIVGSGMSAGHLAGALCRLGKQITILARNSLRIRAFDANPRSTERRWRRRWNQRMSRPRFGPAFPGPLGSMTPELADVVRTHRRQGQLRWIQEPPCDVAPIADERIFIRCTDGYADQYDGVLLATGPDLTAPLPKWVITMAEATQAPLDVLGYPVLDERLHWSRRVHVIGRAAERVLGPLALTLAGARLAAAHLAEAAGS